MNGTFTALQTVTGPEAQPGDRRFFRAIGSQLEFWRQRASAWLLLVSVTDSTYANAGSISLSARNTVVRLDDFGGGPERDVPSPPANSSLPVVSGVTQVSQTLSASPGTWTGVPAPSLEYQWQRCDGSG